MSLLPVISLALLLISLSLRAGGVVTECTETALRAAMAGGGTVTFACDGIIRLSSTLTNATDLFIDGSGHSVTLSGNDAVHILRVPGNTTLTLVNLIVAQGSGGQGAAVFNDGGTVHLLEVVFGANRVTTLLGYGPFGEPLPAAGGAVYNRAGTVSATNCTFIENSAYQQLAADSPWTAKGGAICNDHGQVMLDDCQFLRNAVTGGGDSGGVYLGYSPGVHALGGAIYSDGELTALRCTFRENRAIGGKGNDNPTAGAPGGVADGGAVYSAGPASLTQCTLIGNASYAGDGGGASGVPGPGYENEGPPGAPGGEGRGGAVSSLGLLSIHASTFASNSVAGGAGGRGGVGVSEIHGLALGGPGGPGGAGGSGKGGALWVGAAAELVNSTFAWNSATGREGGQGGPGGYTARVTAPGGRGGRGGNGGDAWGGLADAQGWLRLTNCTVARNRATPGQGGPGGPGGTSGAWYSEPFGPEGSPGTNGLAYGGIATQGARLLNTLLDANSPGGNCAGPILDAGHNLSSDGTPPFTQAGSVNNRDPRLGPLAHHGGPTLTMALLPGSPAIDAGNTSPAPARDQCGFPRPLGAAADIGACEYATITLGPCGPLENGAFQFDLQGPTGLRYVIEAAPNHRDWIGLQTNTLDSGSASFTDTNAPNYSSRRYRTLALP